MSIPTKLISRKLVAARLGVSVSTIKRMEAKKQLTPIIIGSRSVRYSECEITKLQTPNQN